MDPRRQSYRRCSKSPSRLTHRFLRRVYAYAPSTPLCTAELCHEALRSYLPHVATTALCLRVSCAWSQQLGDSVATVP